MAANLRSTPPPDPHPPSIPPANDDGEAIELRAPLTRDQRDLVALALGDVKVCAVEVARRYRRRFTPEDMLAPGTLGLMAAASAYEPDKHPSFRYYASFYIRGAMLNVVRIELFSRRARIEHSMERAYCDFAVHQTLDVDIFRDSDEKLLVEADQGCDDALAAALVAAAGEAETTSPEEAMATGISLRQVLPKLHAHEREVIRLVDEQGLSVAQAALKLRVHTNTAQNRYKRALRKLRKLLLDEGGSRRRR